LFEVYGCSLEKVVANRIFNRVFICRKCNSKQKADLERVRKGKVKCRKCNNNVLRLKNKERKAKVTKTA
jgi:ribosomal protein L40E